jgi:hypothetical protein
LYNRIAKDAQKAGHTQGRRIFPQLRKSAKSYSRGRINLSGKTSAGIKAFFARSKAKAPALELINPAISRS